MTSRPRITATMLRIVDRKVGSIDHIAGSKLKYHNEMNMIKTIIMIIMERFLIHMII